MEESTRVMKRRLKQPQSPLACEACRARKVRCDMATTKSSCSKCEARGIVCKIVPGRRRHLVDRILKARSEHLHTVPQPLPSYVDSDTISPHLISSPSTIASHSPSSAASMASDATSISSYDVLEDHLTTVLDDDLMQQTPWGDPLSVSTPGQRTWELNQLGCFGMPNYQTRREMLQAYCSWVHPTLPMLDLQKLAAVAKEECVANPLLLKAVMMAASAFTGCGTSMRQDLRRQVQAIIRANVEPDPVVELQALILLSQTESDAIEVEDEIYWMSMASSKAEELLLSGRTSAAGSETLRATFWSLLIQDTLVSLTKRKPCQVRIHLPRHCIELPISERWFKASSEELSCFEPTTGLGNESRQVCRTLEDLCTIVRPALKEGSHELNASNPDLSRSLQAWGQRWIPQAQSRALSGEEHNSVHWASIVGVWSLSTLTFFCCSSEANPHRAMPSTTGSAAALLVATAISATTNLYHQLYERNLARNLPVAAVAALAPITAAHLMNTSSELCHIRRNSTQRYYECWQVLRELRTRRCQAHVIMSTIDLLGQNLRRALDTTTVERQNQLRMRAGSISTPLSELPGEVLTPASAMDDRAWFDLVAVDQDDFFLVGQKREMPSSR